MIGVSSFYQIDQRIRKALYFIVTSSLGGFVSHKVLENITNLPFGGIHVYMSGIFNFIIIRILFLYIIIGDFYQLLCVNDQSLLYSVDMSKKSDAASGRALWEKINYFKELTHNFRIRSEQETFYTEFLKKARVGKVTEEDLLLLNGECIQLHIDEAIDNTNNESKTIWLAPTLKNVRDINNINKEIMKKKVLKGTNENKTNSQYKNLTIDIICKHTINGDNNIHIGESKELFKKVTVKKGELKYPPPILTLSIGSRVRVISNIATCIGIYFKLY